MIYVLYENTDWLPPLRRALEARRLPFTEVRCDGGSFDLSEPPAEGVWVNRMSPSAQTRGNGDGVHQVRELLSVLEAWGRPVINGSHAFALEVSKVRQMAALSKAGIPTPHTLAVVGTRDLKAAARRMPLPFLIKHNQGGKGLGVRLFRELDAFDAYVDGPEFEPAFDAVSLLQAYVQPAGAFITRVEIVDGQFLYAIRASTEGGFELCPADACAVDDAFCPVGETSKFSLSPLTAEDPLVVALVRFCQEQQIDVAGIEFVEDAEGRRFTYDINMNTNFNGDVERAHGLDGMAAIAALCAKRLGVAGAALAR